MLLKQGFINQSVIKVFKPTKAESRIMIYNHSVLRMLLRVADKVTALPDLHCSLLSPRAVALCVKFSSM